MKKIIRKAIARIKLCGTRDHKSLMDLMHLEGALKNEHPVCNYCKKIFSEVGIELPGAPAETVNPDKDSSDIIPCFGNLLQILGEEVVREKNEVEGKYMPSQNDLTRWALKDAVLSYYQGLNMPKDLPVMVNRFDDRLKTELAPDFDVIAKIWMEKLDELQRRTDKYGLTSEEFDKAESDLLDGMRGSAFEKQLDRYREEFMQKLAR